MNHVDPSVDRPPVAAGRRSRSPWLALAMAGLIAAGVAGWLASGFYTVKADERAVVRRFGAVTGQVGPGMHYALPWPVTRIERVRTTSVTKAGAGFTLPATDAETATGVEVLTGDENIIAIAVALHYVIRDPTDYLVNIEDPAGLVAATAQSELSQAVAAMSVDEVLTTGRLAIQETVRIRTQAMLDAQHSGVQIVSANLMSITLDLAVAEAFQEVADAMADREKTQNEAHTYASALLPKARGDARATTSDAEAYRRQRVADAIGETARFLALLDDYRKAPDVSRLRLYFETLERDLAKPRLYVVDPAGGSAPINLRLIAP
jgi:modulator of FtsH protease HflK